MSSRQISPRRSKPAGTARRILKVASLGLFGLLAGLLSACSSRPSTRQPGSLTSTPRLENLDYLRTPDIRRAPTLHHHQFLRQSPETSAYASMGQIDAAGHHYEPRFVNAGQ